ncbi:MAG: class I SAM-dependent methyltransferase [Myxococcales bacterium]|nr:class I SAM-dependent methyltransferase [Myxococcales bacterium]
MQNESARISPTADYTSYVWFKNGLSDAALTTPLGRALHLALRPMNLLYEHRGGHPSLDMMLLARHRVIDHLLEQAIASGEVGQVIEVAAGFSPRGFRFARRHRQAGLRYIEGDLPAQADRKRALLDSAGLRGDNHLVLTLDALRESGPDSLAEVAREHLDPSLGTAIITEGLLGYFDREAVAGMWRRFAVCLAGFPHGLYLSDLNLAGEVGGMRTARIFRLLLEAFARGKVHLHFPEAADATAALREAGFTEAALHRPGEFAGSVDVPGPDRRHVVRLIEARTDAKPQQ